MTLTAEQQAEVDRRVAAAMAGNGNGHSNGNGTGNPPSGWNNQQQQQPAPGWGPQPQGGMPMPEKVLVPIKLRGPDGSSVRVDLQFDGKFAEPNALMNLISSLMQQGVPVDTWAPKQQGWGGNGGGYRNGGGNGYGNGGGGGYGRRW